MSEELKNEIIEEIQNLMRTGFYDDEEAYEVICDMFYDEELNEQWVKNEIEVEYKSLLKLQSSWPPTTDFDRLVKTFDELNSKKIIALHNLGYMLEDGEQYVEDIRSELAEEGIAVKGYCFYHGQDLQRACDEGKLYLAFGDFEGDDAKAESIGKMIKETLEANRFTLNWNGSVEERIEVVNLIWRKRFGNDNCDIQRSIDIFRINHENKN